LYVFAFLGRVFALLAQADKTHHLRRKRYTLSCIHRYGLVVSFDLLRTTTTLLSMQSLPFHAGELELHHICALPFTEPRDNPTLPGSALSRYAGWLQRAPLVAVGTLDARGQVWSTLWGGETGFLLSPGRDILAVQARIGTVVANEDSDKKTRTADEDSETGTSELWSWAADPVAASFLNSASGVAASSRMVSLLAVDLEARSRVKLFGNLLASNAKSGDEISPGDPRDVQLVLKIEQALGQCLKPILLRSL